MSKFDSLSSKDKENAYALLKKANASTKSTKKSKKVKAKFNATAIVATNIERVVFKRPVLNYNTPEEAPNTDRCMVVFDVDTYGNEEANAELKTIAEQTGGSLHFRGKAEERGYKRPTISYKMPSIPEDMLTLCKQMGLTMDSYL